MFPIINKEFIKLGSPERKLEKDDNGKLIIKEEFSCDYPHRISLKGILHSSIEAKSVERQPT